MPKDIEKLKAEASAMENYGNFFGQNLFVGAAGVLLMVGTFSSLHIKVNAIDLVLASIPVAVITLLLIWIKNMMLDRYFNKKYGRNEVKTHESKQQLTTFLNFYILIGLQFLYTAYRALRATDKQNELGLHYFGLY